MSMLTDSEAERLLDAVEWVSHGARTIAEVGSLSVEDRELAQFRSELAELVRQAEEPEVSPYLLHLPEGTWAYGVYRDTWALEARRYLERKDCPNWLQDLAFGL